MSKIKLEPVILTKQNGIRQYGFRMEYHLHNSKQELFQFGTEFPLLEESDLKVLAEVVDFILHDPGVQPHVELALYLYYREAKPEDPIQLGDKDYPFYEVKSELDRLFSYED
jgi:hypothetical protein